MLWWAGHLVLAGLFNFGGGLVIAVALGFDAGLFPHVDRCEQIGKRPQR
jgi:hypothetical protein